MKLFAHPVIKVLLVFLLLFSFVSPAPVSAQTNGMYYVVKEGDSLSSIARAFRTSTSRILTINYLSDANTLTPGRKLLIPGFEDVQGEVIKVTLPFDESLTAFNKQLRLPQEFLNRLNFITNPDGFYGGQTYYKINAEEIPQERVSISTNMTGLELAVQRDTNEWTAAEFNNLDGTWDLLPNDTLFFPAAEEAVADSNLTVSPSPMLQGKTVVLKAKTIPGVNISGTLGDYSLHFFPDDDFSSIALQGIYRMTSPGLIPMVITNTYEDGSTFSYQQNLMVRNTDYGFDAELQVADNVVDPAVTEPELAWLIETVSAAPAEKLWSGPFVSPSPTPDLMTSTFGRLRSYNGSPYEYFHSGLDYTGGDTTPIYAAAAGIVVFTGEKTVRGNATIISHGRGVYTGYWHQSRIDVKVGDYVDAGQTIGLVGATGRVTGAHLHFEVLVGGVQVDPTDWLEKTY